MFLSFFLKVGEGFFVKSIASLDDTLTRIPVISHLTKTKLGRIAFSIGTLLALTLIIIIAFFFSSLLNLIPHARQISAVLILILALFVYFEVLVSQSNKRIESRFSSFESIQKLTKIMWVGFLISFITLIDDSFVLVPLFLEDHFSDFSSVIGIYLAAILQIAIVIHFGEKLEKIKYKKEIASASLLILSILVFTGVV